MILDNQTLVLTSSLLFFAAALSTLVFRIGRLRKDGALEWISGFIIHGLAVALFGLRGIIPFFLSCTVGNVFLVASYSLFYAAICKFQCRPYSKTIFFLPAFITFIFFLSPPDNMAYRVSYIASVCSILLGISAWILLHNSSVSEKRSQRILGAIAVLAFGGWLYRLVEGLFVTWEPFNLFPQSIHLNIHLLTLCVLIILISSGFLLMLRERDMITIRKSEEKYRSIFEYAIEGMYQSTVDGRYINVNPAFARMFGYATPEEMIQSVTNIATQLYRYPDEREKIKNILIQQGFVENYEVERLRNDGQTFWQLLNINLVRDGKGNMLMAEGICIDITERKRADAALRQSEDKHRKLIETTDTGYVIIDQNGFVQDANPEYVRLTGHHDFSEIAGRSVMEWTADYEKEKNTAAVKSCFEQGYIRNLEIDYIDKKNGNIIPIEINATCMETEGKIQTITICRDITQRKQAEEALTKSNAQLRKEQNFSQLLFNTSSALIVAIGLDGKTLMMNKALLNTLEYTEEEIKGADYLKKFVPEEDRGMLTDVFQKIIRKGISTVNENRIISKSGRVYLVEWHGGIVKHEVGYADFFVGVGIDITDRKQAEEALLVSEEKFSKTFHKAPILMSINEIENGIYLDVNEKWTEVSGFSREEALGKTSLQLGFMSREDAILLAKKLKDQETVENEEVYLQTKNKRQICCLYSSEIITIGGKQVLLCLSQDITEKKEVEEEKRNLEERLQRSEKMEALGTMAGGVAHDLNNILGVLVGYSELLLMEISAEHPLRRHVDNILKSGERAAAIIQDLLTLARRGVTLSEVTNLNKIIADYFMMPELEALKSFHPHVTIKTNLEKNLLNIKGSPVHLGKTLMNLVSNAAEAITDHGEITIKTENVYLDKSLRGYDDMKEGEYVVLKISDTGKGIAAKDLGKIFEPFYTKKVMGRSGTGLGLAVVWGTVKDHHGYIDVQSEESEGSTFNLYFPATRDARLDAQQALSPDSYKGHGETILIVDDVLEQRELATHMLQKLGYKICSLSSGEKAVEYIKENKVDLLLLDMIMDPGIDGMETYQRILQINPTQKAIIVSGFSETERVKKAQLLGAGSYVRKPYMMESLGLAVRKELDRTKSRV